MNNAFQQPDQPLTVFGGVVPEMSATDIPAGVSAGNQDVDFNLGRVGTRSGLLSAFSFSGTPLPIVNPMTGQNGSGGTTWANPSEITNGVPTDFAVVSVSNRSSAPLQALQYAFNIPLGATVTGVQVQILGKQTLGGRGGPDPDPSATITISPAFALPGASTHTFQFNTEDHPTQTTLVTFGSSTDLWGMNWSNPLNVNSFNFGWDLVASESEGHSWTFSVSLVQTIVWYTLSAPGSFLYVKTFEQQTGDALTLAFDQNGTWWQEDLENTPYVLNPFFAAIEPNTYADSCTFDDREFIALSNLQNGTDMPRTYDGTNVDRLSQVGPAASPAISSTATSTDIATITQPDPVTTGGSPYPGGAQWAAGVNSTSPGNVLIIYGVPFATLQTMGVNVGSVVYITAINSQLIAANGTYFVTSVGEAFGMESGDGTLFGYFTVTAPSTNHLNVWSNSTGVITFQLTLATMTLTQPTNTIEVGSQVNITGVTPSAWNTSQVIASVLNGAQLSISQTSLTGDVATYNYTLISGTAPTIDQQVTVIGCVNGPVVNGTSVFNVANATITSVGADTFSIFPVNAANVPAAAEEGSAIVSGSQFTFDPGITFVGSNENPILGNGTGGSIIQAGGLGAGIRNAVCMFLTRNNLLTACSAPLQFELTESANAITATNIPIGPDNVIARVIAFTGANGSQYYWIPQPVTVTNLDVPTTYTATIINDNTTTTATFNFTDAVLLAADEIDITGANNFQQIEIGSCLGVIAYSGRTFIWGEQNKVQNFTNMSFDGGSLAITQSTAIQPLGWTITSGTSLVESPQFGNALYIQNTTDSTQAVYGLISQTAYQDAYNVSIINPQVQYGVRVTASCPSQIGSGNLVIDLYSASFSKSYGAYTLPLASLDTSMSINTGNLLTTVFVTEASLPTDLVLRLYATDLPSGGDVMIDRIEPFNLSLPVLTTQFRASYANNPEAFDGVTGNCGPNQDQKPILGAAVLFDSLYALKFGSIYSTADPGTSEPSFWTWKTVSTKVGTIGIHAYDYGEDWLVTADRTGLYVFSGGPPIKISQEIQPVWAMIQNRYATVVRNDIENRRITIQCCIPTPNQYMPEFPVNANPITPNVMLMMNYREIDTVGELASQKPVHQTFMGTMKAFDMSRKWSYWNIASPYADLCDRPDGSQQLLICNGAANNKIYELSDTQYQDDGVAINAWYMTFGFPGIEGQQALQLGNHELVLEYGTLTVAGSGNLLISESPNQPLNPNTQTVPPLSLSSLPSLGDYELPFNDAGDRFFIRVGTNAIGDWFSLSKMTLTIKQSPWAPIKGVGY